MLWMQFSVLRSTSQIINLYSTEDFCVEVSEESQLSPLLQNLILNKNAIVESIFFFFKCKTISAHLLIPTANSTCNSSCGFILPGSCLSVKDSQELGVSKVWDRAPTAWCCMGTILQWLSKERAGLLRNCLMVPR